MNNVVAALGRAALVGVLCLALGEAMARLLSACRGRRALLAWSLLMTPALAPSILTGYGWSRAFLALTVAPGWNGVLYSAALILRLMPVAALALYFLPPPLSPEGAHCRRLLKTPGAGWRFFLAGWGKGPWIGFGLVFVLGFGEFELAAMWSLKTWTVRLFDAQTGGQSIFESLRLVAWPAALQALVIGLVLRKTAFGHGGGGSGIPGTGRRHPGRALEAALWAYLGAAAILAVGWPLASLLGDAWLAWAALWDNALLGRDIAASVFFAVGAAVLAHGLAALPLNGRVRCALGVPGLLGGLVLALSTVALFQWPPLRGLYDTPVPLILTLAAWLLPLALGLRWIGEVTRPGPSLHLARMLKNRRLLWELEGRRRAAALFVVFCWAYFEFTAASVLAPTGMTPAAARLHNLLHYGQTAVLAAMISATMLVPMVVLLLTAAGRHLYARIRG